MVTPTRVFGRERHAGSGGDVQVVVMPPSLLQRLSFVLNILLLFYLAVFLVVQQKVEFESPVKPLYQPVLINDKASNGDKPATSISDKRLDADVTPQQQQAQINAYREIVAVINNESRPIQDANSYRITAPTTAIDYRDTIIFMITPTYHRLHRKAEITRLAQTISQVPNLHWILVEDGHNISLDVEAVLKRLIANYSYIIAPTPDYKSLRLPRNLNKGVYQRNAGLDLLRRRFETESVRGVVYFADDDNTYDLRLFEMMRQTETAAVWPVALVGGVRLEKPVLNPATGRLAGFEVGFAPKRKFAVDMAGFCLGLGLVLDHSKALFPLIAPQGWTEAHLFAKFNLTYEDVQVLGTDRRAPDGRLEPLVWHTKTVNPSLNQEVRFGKEHGNRSSDQGWSV